MNSLFTFIFFFIYRFLFIPFSLTFVFLLALLGHKKIQAGLKMRLMLNGKSPFWDKPKGTEPIWIHCSSGEYEYAKPVIRKIKSKSPDKKILVTYFSPTYKDIIEKDPLVDIASPLPWDTPGAVRSFIHFHKPKALLIATTDLWPELLYRCHQLHIPSLLFSAQMGRVSGVKKIFSFYFCWLYGLLSQVYCVGENDLKNFKQLGVKAIKAKGDTRYDQVFYRIGLQKKYKTELFQEKDIPFLIAGSSWPEDEKIIFSATKTLLKEKKLRLIVAPHEPTKSHLQAITKQLHRLKLEYDVYSEASSWNSSVLLIDKVGLLAELYQQADIAIVGGSFKSSVHSVMEPLAAGCLTFVGPFHHNSPEALKYKGNLQPDCLVLETKNAPDFKGQLLKCLDMIRKINELKSLRIKTLAKEQGASQAIIHWLLR